MKKILFPTDFSAIANNAFRYALRIAQQVGAELHVLHTYELPHIKGAHLPSTMEELYEAIKLEALESFQGQVPILKELHKESGNEEVTVNYSLEHGDVVRTIILRAGKDDSNLIIMGTDGAKGLRSIFKGTHAGEVAENASCPVLIIPSDIPEDSLIRIERIAMMLALKGEDSQAIDRVLEFAKLFSANLLGVHIDFFSEMDKPSLNNLKKKYEQVPEVSFHLIQSTDFQEAISDFNQKHSVDVLAMMTHRRNALQEFFQGSLTKQMAYQASTTPILVIQS